MRNYLEFFDLPSWLLFAFILVFCIMQGIGEFLTFKGKIVPEWMALRKKWKRRKTEREALSRLPEFIDKYEKRDTEQAETLSEVQTFLKDVKTHYSDDNISKRDGWIHDVNNKINDLYAHQEDRDQKVAMMSDKMDKTNELTLELLVDSKRNYIINFASKAADLSYPATQEQYRRVFKVHKEYEKLIEDNGLTNDEVDIAYRIAVESYEERTKNHAFLENLRGYDSK